MAKKGKKSSSSTPTPVETTTGKRGKKGKKEETAEQDSKEARRAIQQANRAKVTSTSSWTGKLPHTLLHEICQKRKWNKVEYDMNRIGDKGMLAIAVISWTDPKSKEILSVRLNDPTYDKSQNKGVLVPQETPNEARHMAATVALSRIAYNINLHMMLPPNHRDIWYNLLDYRKDLEKSNPVKAKKLFDTEPFTTLLEEKKNKQQRDKEQEAKSKQSEKIQQAPIIVSSSKTNLAKTNKIEKKHSLLPKSYERSLVRFPKKVWDHAQFIDLDETVRHMIESSLRSNIDWGKKKYDGSPEDDERITLSQKLVTLGFRETHVKEAMNYKDPLSFLLFNLPEDDLPEFFHKRLEDSKNKVEISSLPLSTKMMIERLTESGVSSDEALLFLQESEMNENEAAGKLVYNLCPSLNTDVVDVISEDESLEIWNQEVESLQSIYEDKIESVIKGTSFIMKIDERLKIKLKVYKTIGYPSRLPGFIISTFDKKYMLPNYIKKNILRDLLHYLQESGMVGDMLVYHAYEWLQSNLKKSIDNPGPLLPVSEENNLYSESSQKRKLVGNKKQKSPRKTVLSGDELEALRSEYADRIKSKAYREMLKVRACLPAWKKQDLIVDMIEKNDVVLITGETGSGKSTQVVQFLLDSMMNVNAGINIICTQPRRISAIGLAERVSEERASTCGDEVGYIIRGVNKTKRTTRIKFMTTGVLVRMLQGDKTLLNNSIVVVDEVHERSIDTDLIVTLLKNLLGKVKGLKIVLMSATVNVDLFKHLFGGLATCHIEGRTFPIKDYFLDDILELLDFKIKRIGNSRSYYDDESDAESEGEFLKPGPDSKFFRSGQINYDLLSKLTEHVDERLVAEKNDGSIIIFLPGIAEIDKCCRLLVQNDRDNHFVVLPLHSALTPEDQKRVFKRYSSKRKIVVSTNIAETSITIDDCVATIDSGRAKTMYYNPKENTTRLTESFISKAESKQRRGRAGRVRKGLSFKLYSRRLYEEDMVEMPVPEIKRIALESLYLSVKSMGINDVVKFLASGLEAPPLQALTKAERILICTGLLDETDTSLTELGRYISLMPVMDSKHGKLLIYSIIFGITDFGVLLASILSSGSLPFIGGIENRDAIKKTLSKYQSRGDLLAVAEILKAYMNFDDSHERRKFLKDNMLSYNKVRDIMSSRAQYYSILRDVGFLPMGYKPKSDLSLNRNEMNLHVISAVLTGAFYPHIARVELPDPKFLATSVGAIEKDPDSRLIKYWIRNEMYVDKLETMKDKLKVNEKVNVEELPLPASRAFVHPSSTLFTSNTVSQEDVQALTEHDQSLDKYKPKNPIVKFPFIIFNSSHATTKLYLRDITPTSTLSLLLFGGPIDYDVQGGSHSPGIVLDNWLPIRTWCKNAVLIKELRSQLDQAIKGKLETPNYSNTVHNDSIYDAMLDIVEQTIVLESQIDKR